MAHYLAQYTLQGKFRVEAHPVHVHNQRVYPTGPCTVLQVWLPSLATCCEGTEWWDHWQMTVGPIEQLERAH